jgi:hypothetical protein
MEHNDSNNDAMMLCLFASLLLFCRAPLSALRSFSFPSVSRRSAPRQEITKHTHKTPKKKDNNNNVMHDDNPHTPSTTTTIPPLPCSRKIMAKKQRQRQK